MFALAGAASRFSFRHFETRWQIIIFWAFAAAYQFGVRPIIGRRGSVGELAVDCVAAGAAIVALKVAIEGVGSL